MEERSLILTGRVRSKKSASRFTISDYEIGRHELTDVARRDGICAIYRIHKTVPQDDVYTVVFYADGRRPECTCKWGSFKHEDHPDIVCVHVSLMLTLADLVGPINVPPAPVVAAVPGQESFCDTCGNTRLLPMPSPENAHAVVEMPCPSCRS
jgi:hypothetical protein